MVEVRDYLSVGPSREAMDAARQRVLDKKSAPQTPSRPSNEVKVNRMKLDRQTARYSEILAGVKAGKNKYDSVEVAALAKKLGRDFDLDCLAIEKEAVEVVLKPHLFPSLQELAKVG